MQVSSLDFTALQEELYAALQERKQALLEKDAKVHEAYTTQKAHAMALDKIEQLCAERDVLKASAELTKKQLKEASDEAKMTTRSFWIVFLFFLISTLIVCSSIDIVGDGTVFLVNQWC